MANQLEQGFIKADSRNLPKIDMFMVCEFIKENDKFNASEIRSAKAAMSSRENYGDQAIGYVSLQRDGPICIVKCNVRPEHRMHNQGYKVTLRMDEDEEKIIDVECHDCAAASGGCKHAIAFLMWIHRRSENPSVTEVECYWRRAALASVGSTKKYIESKDLRDASTSGKVSMPDNSTFLMDVVKMAKEKQLDSQLSRHNFDLESRQLMSLSIHQLLVKFKQTGEISANEFLAFASREISSDLCKKAEESTSAQSDDLLWYELRYGRITASKLHEVARCSTEDGSLVQQIIGAAKVFETDQMRRGKKLEKEVLKEVQKKTNLYVRQCGLQLIPLFAILGASPDAIGDDFVVEIKCPSTANRFEAFLPDGKINAKCKAQIQLQMLATGKAKGIFCVADPNFENTREVTIIWENFDQEYLNPILDTAIKFWKDYIFPKLYKSVANK